MKKPRECRRYFFCCCALHILLFVVIAITIAITEKNTYTEKEIEVALSNNT
jgi:hypothetical protein